MNIRALRWTLGILGTLVLLPAVAGWLAPLRAGPASSIDTARIAAAARQAPNFTLEQRAAIAAEIRSQLHPQWRNLSWSAKLARATLLAQQFLQSQSQNTSTQTVASFVGNRTLISNPSGFIALQRQPDCTLTLYNGSFTLGTTPTLETSNSVTGFELALHDAGGLATRPGVYANACADPTLGIGNRTAAYLGRTAQNFLLGAAAHYDPTSGDTELYTTSFSPTTIAMQAVTPNLSAPGLTRLAVGDFNGDGLADIAAFGGSPGVVNVWLASTNGTVGAPATYQLPGSYNEAILVADVTGDGNADIVAATEDSTGQEMISLLAGNGNGTFKAARSFAVPTPASTLVGSSTQLRNLIAADLRGTGRLDIIGSNGLTLLNNGNGTASVGPPAFLPKIATSANGPNLVAGDFNRDGKVDLAVDNGAQISLYLGTGTGSFTPGASYASIGNVGYLAATDLDGDGNFDLYTGVANGGLFSGDEFGAGTAYALMGNGDGTFQGAPALPFVYNGRNLVDLTGSGILDAVGVNSSGSFTSYLGDGKGGFRAHATLSFSPVSIGGSSYTVPGIDSHAFGDINGDGKADLAYIGTGFNGPGANPGIFIAPGDGHGGFGTPAYYAVPSPLPTGDIDSSWSVYNLHLADVNHDGKADLIYNYTDTSYRTNITYFGTIVQLSNGDGTFRTPNVIVYRTAPFSEFPTTETAYVQLVTDLNHDGFPDLIFIAQSPTIDHTLSTYTATIQVALGRGDGTFSTPATVSGPAIMVQSFTDVVPASIAVADMNGDGIPDIVALGASSAYNTQVAIALGNGDGTFRAPALTTYSTQYLNNDQGIAVADFNGDGKPDIVITDPYDPSGSGISPGNGDGTLQTASGNGVTLPAQAINIDVSAAVYAGDLNGDGKADLIAGNVLLLSQAPLAQPDYSAGKLTLPAVHVGSVVYNNMVVSIAKLVSGPSGTTPASGVAVYDPAANRLTAPAVSVGASVYYNTAATVGSLISLGGATGADSYDGTSLTIPSVQVQGGAVYRNVVVTPGKILGIAGGMPQVVQDQYTPASGQLLVPAVQYAGRTYTNVTLTVGRIVAVGGAPP